MKKIYQRPRTEVGVDVIIDQLLANSFEGDRIDVDTSQMEEGDGSDGARYNDQWKDISVWDD